MKPVAGPLYPQVRGGGEGVSGVMIPNPNGSDASSNPKIPEEDTGDHMLVVCRSGISPVLQLPGEVHTAPRALAGAPGLRCLQLGPKVWPAGCDRPELTAFSPG